MKTVLPFLLITLSFGAVATETPSCVKRTSEVISRTVESVGSCSSPRAYSIGINDVGRELYTAATDLSVRYTEQSFVVIENICQRTVLYSQTINNTITETKTFTASEDTGFTSTSSAIYHPSSGAVATQLCEAYRSSQQ